MDWWKTAYGIVKSSKWDCEIVKTNCYGIVKPADRIVKPTAMGLWKPSDGIVKNSWWDCENQQVGLWDCENQLLWDCENQLIGLWNQLMGLWD